VSASPSAFLSVIRPMRADDLDQVVRIEEAAYEFPWTASIFRDCLRVGYDCSVHLAGERIVGYLVLSYGGGEAHVLNLAVAPEAQNAGYGRRLLRRAQRQSVRYGADFLFLEVRPSNRAAVHLYRSEGFRTVGRRRDYYPSDHGREDALVLRLDLLR
jgi:ribosomal-protein-alanine N-acetyltransferase